MPIHELQRIDSSLVLLYEDEIELELNINAARDILSDLNPSIEAIQGPVTQVTMTSLRNQVEATVGPKSLAIADKSGNPPRAEFAAIAARFIQYAKEKSKTPPKVRAYGLNYSAQFESVEDSTALQIIRERFLRTDVSTESGGPEIFGASVNLFYHWDGARCRLTLEPRFSDVEQKLFFAGLNIHHQGQEPPATEEDLASRLGNGSDHFEQTLNALFS